MLRCRERIPATVIGSRSWHGDITSPFPPSGNEGYVRNRDVPYLSVTMSYINIWGQWKHLFLLDTCFKGTLAHRKAGSAFQTGYIALRRTLRSENNHGRQIEGSFQIEVLKTSHFPLELRISKGTSDGHFGLP